MKWKTESLGEIAFMTSGGTPSKKNPEYYEKGTIPWVRSGELENGAIRDTEIKITQAGLDNSSAKILPKGTLLIALYGATIGKLAWLDIEACTNQAVCGIFENEKVSLKYLYYYLLFHRPDLIKQGVGGAQANISQTILKKLMVSYPVDMDEQLCIVARIEELFSELDNGVETLRKTKQQLAVYRQAVLKEAFESCEDKTVQQFGDTLVDKPRNGYSPKGVDYQTKYRNLTLSATTSGFFKEDCFKYIDLDITDDSYLWVKHNDILIQRANTIEYVGTAVLYTGEDNQYVYPDLMMKCHTKEGVLPQFIVYQLQSAVCRNHFRKNATGTSGSMPKINQKTVMMAPVIMVPYDNQRQIVENIESKLSVCDSIEKTVDTALQQAEAMRQSILKKAFEGKL